VTEKGYSILREGPFPQKVPVYCFRLPSYCFRPLCGGYSLVCIGNVIQTVLPCFLMYYGSLAVNGILESAVSLNFVAA
jgi:hypothetical protein